MRFVGLVWSRSDFYTPLSHHQFLASILSFVILRTMDEFAPEGLPEAPEDERIDALSDAFLAAGADPQALEE